MWSLLLVSVPLALPTAHDGQAELPPQFELLTVPGALTQPTDIEPLPGLGLLVAEKRGTVLLFRHLPSQAFPQLEPQPVLDLTAEVNVQGDRGLLGIAVPPDFTPDGSAASSLYLLYTASPVPGADLLFDAGDQYSHSMLTRYALELDSAGDLVAVPASRQVLLGERLPDGTAPDAIASLHESHSNGSIAFAPDGTLLFATGDGAHFDTTDFGGLDPPGFDDFVNPLTGLRGQLPREQDSGAFRARDLRSLAGKVLRVDAQTGLGLGSNPFFDGDATSLTSRIWATGFRNAFRLTHRPGTGDTDPSRGDVGQWIVGDVGSTRTEELDLIDGPGLDFGWPCFEGFLDTPAYGAFMRPEPNPFGWLDCADAAPGPVRGPLLAIDHALPQGLDPLSAHTTLGGEAGSGFTGASVIGGDFIDGGAYPVEYQGRYLFSDYAEGWLRTAELDAAGGLVEVRDFGEGLTRPTCVAFDPTSGEVYLTTLGIGFGNGRLLRLRYGENASPEASLSASPSSGTAPLTVDFDASESTDPERQPLVYRFHFGDGSAPVEGPSPTASHVYEVSNIYTATLEVIDDAGLSAFDSVPISVGLEQPLVAILSPPTGTVAPVGELLELSGGGLLTAGTPLDFEWRVDLYHDTHVHPAFFVQTDLATQTTSTVFPVAAHGQTGEVDYYEITLTATAPSGASASTSVWAYPAGQTIDMAATASIESHLDALDPPVPQGGGSNDLETLRDGVTPGLAGTVAQTAETFHPADTGGEHWVGWRLTTPPAPESRLVALEFQEGLHAPDGGWFDDLRVEVEVDGLWRPASGLSIQPPYPDEPRETPPFEAYTLHFDPVRADAIRLIGTPGGSAGFVSLSEMRARMVDPAATTPGPEDLSGLGQIVSLVQELGFDFSGVHGNADPETIRNGTQPPTSTTSSLPQVATFAPGHPPDVDWIGYQFPAPRTFVSLLFQEGLAQGEGGWFESLALEYRDLPGDPWLPVPGAVVTPAYRSFGPGQPSYERFTIDFPPLIATALRVIGDPGGSASYASCAELSIFGPDWDPETCGIVSLGGGTSTGALSLSSTTPPVLGFPCRIELHGAAPNSLAAVGLSFGSTVLPLPFGVLLLDPSSLLQYPVAIDAAGDGRLDFTVPTGPELLSTPLFLQGLTFELQGAVAVLSNAVVLQACP